MIVIMIKDITLLHNKMSLLEQTIFLLYAILIINQYWIYSFEN